MDEAVDPLSSIRSRIVRGEYGARQRLYEKELADELGASRFLVRSALLQLAGEGFVELQRNRGARVREITLDEALEFTDLRKVIEGSVAARAAQLVTEADITELQELAGALRAAADTGDVDSYTALSDDLHRRLLEISRYVAAPRFLEQLNPQMLRRQFGYVVTSNLSVNVADHLEIIDAVCARRATEAEQLMRSHVEGARGRLLSIDHAVGPNR